MKRRANIPIAKFIKNDLISIFIMKTISEYNIIGEEQYNMRQRVWIIGLNYEFCTFWSQGDESLLLSLMGRAIDQ